jgi:hypothetical protein
MPSIIRRFFPLVLGLHLGLLPAAAQTNLNTREWIGRVTNGPVLLEAFRLTTANIRTQSLRLPPQLATNSAFATNNVRILLRTNFYSYTNLVFQGFLPDTLPHVGPISSPTPMGANYKSGRSAPIPSAGQGRRRSSSGTPTVSSGG